MPDLALLDAAVFRSQQIMTRDLSTPVPPPRPLPPLVDYFGARTQAVPPAVPFAGTPVVSGGGGLIDAAKEGWKTGNTNPGTVASFWNADSAAQFVNSWGFPYPVNTIEKAMHYSKAMANGQLMAGPRFFWGTVWSILASRHNKATTGIGFN